MRAILSLLAAAAPLAALAETPEGASYVAAASTPFGGWAALHAGAVRESKPLAVWVGYRCPSSADQVPGFVHFHAPGRSWRGVDGPAVVVLVPGGDGQLYRGAVVRAEDCCASSLRRAVEDTLGRWERERAFTAPLARTAPAPASSPPAFSFAKHVRGWASSRDGSCGAG